MSEAKALRAPRAAVAEKGSTRRSDVAHVARLLNRFLLGNRKWFGLAFLMLLFESGTSIAAKFPLAYLVDYVSGAQPDLQTGLGLPTLYSPRVDTVVGLTLVIVVIALFNSVTDSLTEIYLARGGRMLGFNLRAALYSHLQKLSLAFYSGRRTGDLMTRVTGDVTALEEFSIGSLKDIAGSIFLLTLTIITLLVTSWQVALLAVLMVPPLALVSNYFSDRIKAAAKKQRAREGDLASTAQEMLTSIRVIQTYSRGPYEQKRFAQQSQRTMDVALEAARLQAWFSGVINVLQAVVVAVVVWLGVWLIDSRAITVGALVFFIGLIQEMFKPTKRIIKQWNEVGKIFASAERIGELLDRKPAVQDEPGAVEAPPFKGEVEYRHVSFAYQPDPEDAAKQGSGDPQPRLALNDVNLNVEPGEVVALVGGSGAGKSTIVQLLPRLYDPHLGEVLVDGHDIREFTLDSLRSQIGMVLQDTILFTGTVADNIAYGLVSEEEPNREEIIAAAQQANAHDFIMQMPDGYETQLSERASNLSGGQRQRIAIARAFIRNAPILILDEPTTGLDAESSDLVLQALRTLMNGKTTIIISHDLNLIRHADKIVVVKDGSIEQEGTHESLLGSGGLYADLYHKQFGQAEGRVMPPEGEGPGLNWAEPKNHQGVPSTEYRVPSEPGTLILHPSSLIPHSLTPGAPEEDDTSAPAPAFETMLLKALPTPVTRQAFETMFLRKRDEGWGMRDALAPTIPPSSPIPHPSSVEAPSAEETFATAPDAGAPDAPDGESPAEHSDAIFHTSVMKVLPRRPLANREESESAGGDRLPGKVRAPEGEGPGASQGGDGDG